MSSLSSSRAPRPSAIILIGIPGSGKSTFYHAYFSDTHLRINLDMLRTRHREQVLLQACIAVRQPLVIDNTNPARADRARYLGLPRAGGFLVTGYYFSSPLADALERNRQRRGKAHIPDKGVLAAAARLETPTAGEGFDQLFQVAPDGQGGFVVNQWPETGDGSR